MNPEVQAILDGLSPTERKLLETRLDRVLRRRAAMARFPTPAHLAQYVRPDEVQTPMLDLLDDVIAQAWGGIHRKFLINTPPQEGKTSRLSQIAPVWLLLHDPSLRIGIASYEQGIAGQSTLIARQIIEQHGSGLKGQRRDPEHEDVLGLTLDPDRAQGTNWALTDIPGRGRAGGMLAAGIGSALTGRPLDVLIVDDPLKDAAQADSPVYRQRVRDWYQAVATTRLSGAAIVIVIQCLTGDTPVLMADGTERPLRGIRPGDQVATYENGTLTTATVRRAANRGPDRTLRVRMTSGVEVRGNARHPFLVRDEEGHEAWRRLGDLQPGDAIVRATRPEEASPESSAGADSPRSARANACPATAATDGQPATDLLQPIPPHAEPPTSSTGTGSPSSSTTPPWNPRAVGAPSANSSLAKSRVPATGASSCASTMTTAQGPSGGCSATTATSSSHEVTAPRYSTALPPTCGLTTDRVLEVVPSLDEDVYDLEIERTENFIAAGLCVHNTRWHEDDLTGWLLREDEHLATPYYRHINVPAQAEDNDPLGRKPGDWLLSARGRSVQEWEDKRRAVGTRWWFALYQGHPTAPEGGIFKRAWFDHARVAVAPELRYVLTFVDPADNTGGGDEAGIMTGGIGVDNHFYLLADDSGHYTVAQWVRQAVFAMCRWGSHRIGYEKSLSGLRRSIAAEWKQILLQARCLSRHHAWQGAEPWPVKPNLDAVLAANVELGNELDTDVDLLLREQLLLDLWPYVPAILDMPVSGPPVRMANPKRESKTRRAEFISPLFENGQAHPVGHFPTLEHQMCTWLTSQDSPDRMDACVWLMRELSIGGGARMDRPRPGPAGRNTIDTAVARSARNAGMAIRTRP